jgi:hypothetical protein
MGEKPPVISLQLALKVALSRPPMSPRVYRRMRHDQEVRAEARTRKPHECKACHRLFKTAEGRDHHFRVKHR